MPFQVLNPMEAMQVGADRARANRLADIQEADIVRARREQEMLNQLYQQAYNSKTGQVDANRLYGGMIGQGMGTGVPKLQAAEAELLSKRASAAKTQSEADKIFLDNSRAELAMIDPLKPDAQQRYVPWAIRMIQRAPWAAQILPDTLTPESHATLLRTADMINPKGEVRQIGGATATIDPYTGKQIGAAIADVPLPTDVVAQKKDIASAGKTSISIPISTGKKFGETIAEQAGKELGDMQKQAQAGLDVQESIRRLQPLLNSKDFISGTLGDARLAVAKALGLPGATETQAYFAGIGDQVASRIKAFGSGSAISNADREFAEKIAGGSIELTPDAIKRIVRLNDESAALAVKGYNKRRKFLMKANPEIANYFDEITPKSAQPSDRDVVRTGTLNGRKVVQYSDGTTEYAD